MTAALGVDSRQEGGPWVAAHAGLGEDVLRW